MFDYICNIVGIASYLNIFAYRSVVPTCWLCNLCEVTCILVDFYVVYCILT